MRNKENQWKKKWRNKREKNGEIKKYEEIKEKIQRNHLNDDQLTGIC